MIFSNENFTRHFLLKLLTYKRSSYSHANLELCERPRFWKKLSNFYTSVVYLHTECVYIIPRNLNYCLFLGFFNFGSGDVDTFSQCSYYCWSALAKSAAAPFFIPPPASSRRPPGWGWGQPAHSSHPADSPTVRMFSKMVIKPRQSSLWSPGTFSITPSSPRKAVWAHLADFLRAADPWKSDVNHFSWHILGLSEFHDTLSPIILYFGGNISDGNLRGEILWSTNTSGSLTSLFKNRLKQCSRQIIVTVELLDNFFLNLTNLFLALTKDSNKFQWYRMVGGKERKMNSRSATTNQVRGGGKGWNKSFCKQRAP
jgi:hypothetical protein